MSTYELTVELDEIQANRLTSLLQGEKNWSMECTKSLSPTRKQTRRTKLTFKNCFLWTR